MAIAEHAPAKLYKRNKGLLKMSKSQLHDFAATKGLKRKYVRKKTGGHTRAYMAGKRV